MNRRPVIRIAGISFLIGVLPIIAWAGIDGSSLFFSAVDTDAAVFDSFELDLLGDEDGEGISSGEEFSRSWDPSSPYSPRPGWVGSGDYNGDGTDEIAVFRPATGLWVVRGLSRVYYGAEGDAPATR